MAFGNAVNELEQSAVGTVGYIIKVDTHNLRAYNIEFVQAQAEATSTPAPATIASTLETLMGYLNDNSAPDLAFYDGLGECYIFFKTSVFPYIADTRFAMYGRRNAYTIGSTTQYLDILEEDLDLFLAYAIKTAAMLSGKPVPYDIQETIRKREAEITGNVNN